MTFSVIVPIYNARETLPALLESLTRLHHVDHEVILVDDASTDGSAALAASSPYRVIPMAANRGPARCRNAGAAHAQGDILVFTDADCRVHPQWLDAFAHAMADGDAAAVMGRLELMPSTVLGDAISALGFPAGGSVGFSKIWRVDAAGFTQSLSTCNCAVTRTAFDHVGGFDEGFPYAGGEDSYLAHALDQCGYRIRYCPAAVAWHPARDRLGDFFVWQFRRGISSYLFAKRVVNKQGFLRLRAWSTANVIRHSRGESRFPLVMGLLAASVAAQLAGFVHARIKDKRGMLKTKIHTQTERT